MNSGHEYISSDKSTHTFIEMDTQSVKRILDILLYYDYHLSVHTTQGKYIFKDTETYYKQHIEIAKKKRNSNLEGLEHSTLFHKETFLYNCLEVKTIEELIETNAHILKIDARNMELSKVHESLTLIKTIPDIIVHSSFESYLEISDTKADKAKMLEVVIKEKGIKKDEVCIFGDSMNDLELFESFEETFAMDNANMKIKSLAKYITSSNDDDGVAKGIQLILDKQ